MKISKACGKCVDEGSVGISRRVFWSTTSLLVASALFAGWLIVVYLGLNPTKRVLAQGLGAWIGISSAWFFVVLIVSLFFVYVDFISTNILRKGREYYIFLDENGTAHSHRTIELASSNAAAGVIAGFNVGGLFAEDRLFGKCSATWRLLKCGELYYFEDKAGQRLLFGKPEISLKRIQRFESVSHMTQVHETQEALSGYLIASILEILEVIKQDKERMGRSPHAKNIREHFEDVLSHLESVLPDFEHLLALWKEGSQIAEDQENTTAKVLLTREAEGMKILLRSWDARWNGHGHRMARIGMAYLRDPIHQRRAEEAESKQEVDENAE